MARLAAQLSCPAGVFDDRPRDSFVVQRSGLIDPRRKDDLQGALGGARLIARIHRARRTDSVCGRFSLPDLVRRARVDDVRGRAVSLRRAALERAFDIGAEGGAASEQDGEAGAQRKSDIVTHGDHPFVVGVWAGMGLPARKARRMCAGR